MRREENRAFLPALRRLERRLALPIPRRIRLLRELEWDLEEIRDDLEARGVAPEEARDRALEILLPGEASVLELTRLHRPFYRKVTRNLAHDRITLMERGALGLMTVVVLGVQVAALRHTETLGSPSPFLWVVLLWGTLLFLFLLAKAFQLWVKGDHGNPEQGLDALLGLVALTLGTGVLGVLVDTSGFLAQLQQRPETAGMVILPWLIRECSLLSLSILLSLAGGLLWWGMAHWVSLVSGARREVLGELQPVDPSASRR